MHRSTGHRARTRWTGLGIVLLAATGLTTVAGPAAASVDRSGAASTASAGPTLPGMFTAAGPVRVLDTRIELGASTPAAHGTVHVRVTGLGGVPSSGVSAVVVNLTVVSPGGSGYVTAWADGTARPLASVVNFRAGETVANGTVVGVGADGKVALYNGAASSTNLVLDVSGYYRSGSASAPGAYTPVAPVRMVDSRVGRGLPTLNERIRETVHTSGTAGLPASGVSAIVVNVTVVSATSDGDVTVWDGEVPRPAAPTVAFRAGQTIADGAVVPIGSGDEIGVWRNAAMPTNVIIDVVGYYRTGFAEDAGSLTILTPTRVLDTRSSVGAAAVPAHGSATLQVAGLAAVPSSGVSAVVANVTVPASRAGGYLTVWPDGRPRPTASTVNFGVGQAVANDAVIPVGANGKIILYNGSGASTDIALDITGYFLATTPPQPVRVARGPLTAGDSFSCALRMGGTVACWGSNDSGRLGVATQGNYPTPVPVPGLTGAAEVAAGDRHGCALLGTGRVECWPFYAGASANGGAPTSDVVPEPKSGIFAATAVASGNDFSCALVEAGTVDCWGDNRSGELGDGTAAESVRPVQVAGLSGATSLAAGENHACAVTRGAVRCWGTLQVGNGVGLFPAPVAVPGIHSAIALAAGQHHTCALLAAGTVDCWGRNDNGQLGDGTFMTTAAPVPVAALTDVVAVAAGAFDTCALLRDGHVDCWGDNTYGRLGDGTTTDSNRPVRVLGLSGVTAIAAGEDQSCAQLADGPVECWGGNSRGQLGDGSFVDRPTPVRVVGL